MIQPKKENFSKVKTTSDFHKERERQGQRIGVINLGCARNLVDAQAMLGRMKGQGHRIVDPQDADVAILNTCSFIEEAKQESIDAIIDLLELKKQGKLRKVIVAGCLAQRYGKELAEQFKDLDAVIGVEKFSSGKAPDQVHLTPKHYAYVKICESCYNACKFCAIPKIKGKFVSRKIENVLEEVKRLDAQGIKEINLIGQDITAYGMDLYREKSLARLLKEMVKVTKNIKWIRLLYAFPAHVTDELIDVIASEDKICKYIDMPLQHISDHILQSMNRNITTAQTRELIQKIKTRIPQATLRTTYIVGMPGETKEDFDELMSFVRESAFDKVGVFIYSKEEGTEAFDMKAHVNSATKRKRMNELMTAQQAVSEQLQSRYVGQMLPVLIEEKEPSSEKTYIGRTPYDAPDVDGVIYVHSDTALKPGDFVDVRVTDSLEYDLIGSYEKPS